MKKVMFNNSELSGSFGQENTPIGTILMYGGTRLPFGFLWCNGSAVSRTVYADLFNAIGTAFGSGDGSTTFNLPDYRESVPIGAGHNDTQTIANHDEYTVGQFKDDQIQTHEHQLCDNNTPINANTTLFNSGTTGKLPITNAISYQPVKVKNMISCRSGDTTHGKQLGCNFIIKFCKAITPAQEQFIDDSVVSAEKTFSSAKISTIGELKNYTTNIATTPITAERNGIAFVHYNPPTSSAASNVTIKRVSGSNTDNFSEYTTLGLQLRVIIPLKKGDIISENSKTNASYVNTEIIYF